MALQRILIGAAIIAVLFLSTAVYGDSSSYYDHAKGAQIQNSAAATVTNYPVCLYLHNTAGTNTFTDIYLNGGSYQWNNGIPKDIRFTNGASVWYNYWIENTSSNESVSKVWVSIPSIDGGGGVTTLTLHYGNATCPDAQNAPGTFSFFDHFDGAYNSTEWTTTGTGTVDQSGSVLSISTSSAANTQVNSTGTRSAINQSVMSYIKTDHYTNSAIREVFYPYYNASTDYALHSYSWNTGALAFKIRAVAGGTETNTALPYWSAGVWHRVEIRRTPNSLVSLIDNTNATTITTNVSALTGFIQYLSYGATGKIYTDWVAVRSFVSPEPQATTQNWYGSPYTGWYSIPETTATGISPLHVHFYDDSLYEPTSWLWQFGDTWSATTEDTSHTYNSWIGNTTRYYQVNLSGTNVFGTNWSNTTNAVCVQPQTASFSANVTSGTWPLSVQFTDASTVNNTVTNTYNYNFGDGNTSNSSASPIHTYYTAGTYKVILNVTSDYSYGWGQNATITVSNPAAPDASFTIGSGSHLIDTEIQFTDTTTGTPPFSYAWSWGDGTPNSTAQNPTHSYTAAGTYTVILTVSNIAGSDAYSSSVVISDSVLPNRPRASRTVQAVDTLAYSSIMEALGGTHIPENESDVSLNISGIVTSGMLPYTNLMGALAWLIAIAIPIIMIWIVQEKAWIPLGLGLILGGGALSMGWIPADWYFAIVAFMALCIGGIIYALYKGRT